MEMPHMKLTEIVNIDELRGLCESFTALSGAVTAILDLEGNILILKWLRFLRQVCKQ